MSVTDTPGTIDRGTILLAIMKLRTFIALIAVVVFFSIFAPNFLSSANFVLMSKHVALNAFLSETASSTPRGPKPKSSRAICSS